jgi:hypothetical protein
MGAVFDLRWKLVPPPTGSVVRRQPREEVALEVRMPAQERHQARARGLGRAS